MACPTRPLAHHHRPCCPACAVPLQFQLCCVPYLRHFTLAAPWGAGGGAVWQFAEPLRLRSRFGPRAFGLPRLRCYRDSKPITTRTPLTVLHLTLGSKRSHSARAHYQSGNKAEAAAPTSPLTAGLRRWPKTLINSKPRTVTSQFHASLLELPQERVRV